MSDNSSEFVPLYAPGFERRMAVITVMMVAIIEVLDMTIVSVALPHMMGAFGANPEQITWVVTSYIVSSAIVMLVTGFLIDRWGCRRVMFVGVVGFLGASIFCGLSTSLEMLVFFRVLQGIFGAVLVPLSQFVIRQSFPKNEQAKGMAIWGMGIMVAPILGPMLGGYITDIASWRWIFYVNVPVCLLALIMTARFLKETELIDRPFDKIGMLLMGGGVGALQLFLDRGNTEGWFESRGIQIIFVLMIVFLSAFIIRGIGKKDNILNFSIFKNRNFTLGMTLLAIYCGGFFGIATIQPIMLEQLMGYPASLAGIVTAPRGITSALTMIFVSRIVGRVDPRWPVAVGMIIAGYTAYLLSHLNLDFSLSNICWIAAIQGVGTGLIFVPLSTLAFGSLSQREASEASGMFSFSRNLGISMGTALLGTIISRQSQTNWNQMGGHIHIANPNLTTWLQAQHLTLQNPAAIMRLVYTLSRESGMMAYLDAYWAAMITFIVLVPIIFVLKFRQA